MVCVQARAQWTEERLAGNPGTALAPGVAAVQVETVWAERGRGPRARGIAALRRRSEPRYRGTKRSACNEQQPKREATSVRSIAGQIFSTVCLSPSSASFPVGRHIRQLAPDRALVKLSFSHHGKPVSDCHQTSAAELAKLPPNMRAPVRCPRERSPVTVELDA